MSDLPMDGVIRVSHVGGRAGERFQSPGTQRDAIEGWARAHGVTIGMIHEDLDKSGGTMDRPGMNLALQRVRDGRSSGVIVSRLDRFARTVVGGLTTIHELHEQGARVVSVAESIDPATPMGRAMLGLLLIMAEWQRDQANEHIAGAQAKAAGEGRYAIRASYGYVRTGDGQTVVDEAAAAVVRDVFAWRADRVGWGTICGRLDDAGVLNPSGERGWATSTVSSMVRAEAYLGVWNGPRGLRVEDAWPPIVTRELWEAANAIRGTVENDLKHRDRLCLNVARCAMCRYPLGRVVNPAGFVSYACQKRRCEQRGSMSVTMFDDHVRTLVDERLANIMLTPVGDDAEGDRLVAARDTAVEELEAWRDDLGIRQALGATDWREGLLARARQRDRADADVRQHRTAIGLPDMTILAGGGIPPMHTLDWTVQRDIVLTLIHSVWLRKSPVTGEGARQHVADRLHVVWADDPVRPAFPGGEGSGGPVVWQPS